MESSLFAPLRHCKLVFFAETKRLVAYRAQFWFELILSSLIEITIALAIWRAVFISSGVVVLGGFTLPEMVLYLAVAIFFGQATKGTGVGTFQREVYEGTLTKYLIFPLSVYSYKFGTFLPRSFFAVVQMFVALSIIYLSGNWPAGFALEPGWVLAGLLTVFLACLLSFFLIILVETLSFWVDNVWTLSYALQIAVIFLSGKAIPLNFFPDWLATIIKVSPFPYLVYFPTQSFLGAMTINQYITGLLIMIGWTAVAFLASYSMMQRGLRQYTGVGQ